MIEWVHDMCRLWARQARHDQSGYAKRSPCSDAKDYQGGGIGSFRVTQFAQESFTGEGLMVHVAVRGDMTAPWQHPGAPVELQVIHEWHYMDRRKPKQKAPELGISVSEYWRYVDRLHYWIAARVPREANCRDTVAIENALCQQS